MTTTSTGRADVDLTEPAPDPQPASSRDAGAPEETRRKSRTALAVLVVLLVTAALGVTIALVAANDSGGTPDAFVVSVPSGTGEQVAGGTDYVDAVIRLEPGQELRLENDDVRLHSLGSLSAGASETVSQTFATEGRYVGVTSLRANGRVTILVESQN